MYVEPLEVKCPLDLKGTFKEGEVIQRYSNGNMTKKERILRDGSRFTIYYRWDKEEERWIWVGECPTEVEI